MARKKTAFTSFDVADALGLSRATVSAVLRGQADKLGISSTTAERVLDTAKRLNYYPNKVARSLRSQRTGVIGAVLINFKHGWTDSVMEGMESVLSEADRAIFVATHRMVVQRAIKELTSCLMRHDEGIICQPVPGATDIYKRIKNAGRPLIFLGDYPEDVPDVSFVGWDSPPAVRVAVEHLIQTGRRRIGFIGIDYPMKMARARYLAYHEVLQEAGLVENERWVAIPPLLWPVEQIINWALDRMFVPGQEHPDGILARNDDIGLAALEGLRARGIRVPDDVALIGLGDLPVTNYSGISLSTVKEPTVEIGREAARLMLQLIDNPEHDPVHRLIPGRELKIRGTTQRAEEA